MSDTLILCRVVFTKIMVCHNFFNHKNS